MIKICYYVSDYGLGHASRSIAVIRRIISEMEDVHVTVKCGSPFLFLKNSLEGTEVECIRRENDIGVILTKESPEVDYEKTKIIFKQWMATWLEYIAEEAEFLQKESFDLVISDIVPQVFVAADAAGIPSIAISNFTWHLIFTNLFGTCSETEALLHAYEKATCAMRLPFHEPMNVFSNIRDIPLISRAVTVSPHDMREYLGIGDEKVVFLNIPNTEMYITEEVEATVREENIRILLPTNCKAEIPNSIAIPKDTTESQNWVAMCDLVVCKVGYSTISEAVHGNVPLLLMRRKGFAEDIWIIETVEKGGFGKEISKPELMDGKWLENICNNPSFRNRTINSEYCDYKYDGIDTILDTVTQMIP